MDELDVPETGHGQLVRNLQATQPNENELPEGTTYHMNSKRLKLRQLKRIAEALGVTTESASAADIRTIIEGKLRERDQNPVEIQVTVQGSDDDDGTLFLINDEGVILTVEAAIDSHVPDTEVGSITSSRSALRGEHVSRSPSTEPGGLEATVSELRLALESERQSNEAQRTELASLREALAREKEKVKRMWRQKCEQLLNHEDEQDAKDAEIRVLRAELATLQPSRERVAEHSAHNSPVVTTTTTGVIVPRRSERETVVRSHTSRVGKAPPIDTFTGENSDVLWEDWLPTFERAAHWNDWSEDEKLLQLAGYLRKKALQEWNLLSGTQRSSFTVAIEEMQNRLDPGSKALAAQDFRHTVQSSKESVSDFIRRLEQVFRRAYGKERMSTETRDTLLHGQLQEGLSDILIKAPAVSGALTYQELCVAAKNEERRQKDLSRRHQYRKDENVIPSSGSDRLKDIRGRTQTDRRTRSTPNEPLSRKRCYVCNSTEHLMKDCHVRPTESSGSNTGSSQRRPTSTRQSQNRKIESTGVSVVSTEPGGEASISSQNGGLLDILFSDSDSDSEVKVIRVSDEGSKSQCALVGLQGVLAYGIIDTAADITIVGGRLFKKVATIARLKKKNLKPPDKKPRTYDQRTFTLDGRMDLDITFDGKTMCTPVYIKMDAQDQLLLAEGVCRQLGIVSYHPEVETWRGGSKGRDNRSDKTVTVPSVRVNMLKSMRVLPNQSTLVTVKVDGEVTTSGSLLLQPEEAMAGLLVEESLVTVQDDGTAHVSLVNLTGFTQTIDSGTTVGTISEVDEEIQLQGDADNVTSATVNQLVTTDELKERKQRLASMLTVGDPELQEVLLEYHHLFSLDEEERGETDIIQMNIDTGEAAPIKQPARRMPYAARQEVTRHIRKMQEANVIRPSRSPWSSPIVLVKKKDGTLRFCVDYRRLNSVTKADTFPLPRMDDILDQLGDCKFFSTLDLKSGYWQIRVHPDSQEKTAFITPQGLYEFRVMPFGLMNGPAVFQRLMQQVVMGLNPEEGPDHIAVYLDDILVFSKSLDEHRNHLKQVFQRIEEVGLKLNPKKCSFACQRVEYLGHIITAQGLKPNPDRIEAVKQYKVPHDVHTVRQFLGLTSFYRRFVPGFAQIASPLHELTKKGIAFKWTEACQTALDQLKDKLVESPVLAYPNFNEEFTLETDASVHGLGAILSQVQEDKKLHPVAYASRALSDQEKRYAITELETLAVVWAISHFHSYLYGHDVTVLTDHSAVKAVLCNPGGSSKHARWWTRVFGAGIRNVDIIYRAGRDNANADALSRQPHLPAPAVGTVDDDAQVLSIETSDMDISSLLELKPELITSEYNSHGFSEEQKKDEEILSMIRFQQEKILPEDTANARRIAAQAPMFTMIEEILYYLDDKQPDVKRIVVPKHLRVQIMQNYHSSIMAGHFSGVRLYKTLSRRWWWDGMYSDAVEYCKNCPQCAIVSGTGRKSNPPLKPIPVERVFQIVGVDIMELPKTSKGNQYVVVFQDFLSKWPFVFATKDQKATTLAKLLVEEVVPVIGVPEALLSDRGTNLLSHLMRDVCELLGVAKLNTTAYHPQCNGLIERFNRTLKMMLRKHVDKFGPQWDRFLPGVLWAYRNTPHDSTGEKPSFLLFGVDCRSPTEAALVPTQISSTPGVQDISDYREELILSLSEAREGAHRSICKAQKRYKAQHDKRIHDVKMKLGDWVLIYFPAEDSGKQRKLSRPWHGPYRIVAKDETNVSAMKVYFPDEKTIKVHQNRVQMCPFNFPAGYYWYGKKRASPEQPPKWVERLLTSKETENDHNDDASTDLRGEDLSDENDRTDVIEEETVIPAQCCDVPSPTSSQPAQKTRTRVIKPPARYS